MFGANLFQFNPEGNAVDAAYRERFAEVMNFATLPFYWSTYEPERGRPETAARLEAARWCRARGILPKGHPLIWNDQPPWVAALVPEQAERLMWARIPDELHRFAGQIDCWDVVNEATEGRKYARQRGAEYLDQAYARLGVSGVIQRAFKSARAANPRATLILNDFMTGPAYPRTIEKAVRSGAEVDVIGFQAHMHAGYWGAEKLWNVCESLGRYGKPVHLTELTLVSGELMADENPDWETQREAWPSTPEGEQRQAEQVAELYRLLFSHPSVTAISWWDFSDRGAWLGAPGGLLRADMTPKPAYERIRQLIQEEWTTELTIRTDVHGGLQFRGYYGQYEITALLPSGERTAGFRHERPLDTGPHEEAVIRLPAAPSTGGRAAG
ncbi:MAG: endo-1,4-beta-xylanase [Planctomycetota bacterium]